MPATFARVTIWSTGAVLTATALNGEFDNLLNNLTPAGVDDASANLTAMRATRDPYSGATAQLASSLEDELQAIRYQLAEITGNTYWYEDAPTITAGLPPVGSIIGHFDFNAAVTIDTDYWVYCNGATISDVTSPLDGLTVPDLSGRYLVGFGTEAGANIHSAAWAATAVGNASHQVNLAHVHTGPSHTHGVGSLVFQIGRREALTRDIFLYTNTSGGEEEMMIHDSAFGVGSAGGYRTGTPSDSLVRSFYTGAGSGATATGGTGNTGSTLSATQSIQPSSVRVRWIMRKK